MIAAGRLRHRVLIQRPVNVQNPSSGAMTSTWQDVATVWAEVAPVSVREFVSAQAYQNQITTRITIRYRQDISPKYRMVFRNDIYNIEGILPDNDSGLEYLTIPCSSGVNDG